MVGTFTKPPLKRKWENFLVKIEYKLSKSLITLFSTVCSFEFWRLTGLSPYQESTIASQHLSCHLALTSGLCGSGAALPEAEAVVRVGSAACSKKL